MRDDAIFSDSEESCIMGMRKNLSNNQLEEAFKGFIYEMKIWNIALNEFYLYDQVSLTCVGS